MLRFEVTNRRSALFLAALILGMLAPARVSFAQG